MNSTIDSTPVNAISPLAVSQDADAERPYTQVFQPVGAVDYASSRDFLRSLEQAIDTVIDSVIIDFIWVETVDEHGIAALVAIIERAAIRGKSIVFQSMNHRTRKAMEIEWERQRALQFGCWKEAFAASLEQFLESWAH